LTAKKGTEEGATRSEICTSKPDTVVPGKSDVKYGPLERVELPLSDHVLPYIGTPCMQAPKLGHWKSEVIVGNCQIP